MTAAEQDARRSIERIPTASVFELDAVHGPWLVDPAHVAYLIEAHTRGFTSIASVTH